MIDSHSSRAVILKLTFAVVNMCLTRILVFIDVICNYIYDDGKAEVFSKYGKLRYFVDG